ncbi:prolyl oligopeptidase family serine peptidase [Simiduia sp. 21SJ11W-1]|uniref:carboxylesterase family protein n=1 Tax=Simiduia sp. 21SJ11W-1 TaxID=2909669 RepID=UPI00209F1961|nr:alpha/beta hydrolase-fold protein [Simiduia sp. 21SJ11W-1]UTA48350.1 prolyl oligopeptidase family serine peptidase [Simiduia sp. 21SJ11W-1]
MISLGKYILGLSAASLLVLGCTSLTHETKPTNAASVDTLPAQLKRQAYISTQDGSEREYFVYLPQNYGRDANQRWPVLLFLHGNGERGDGKKDLDFVLTHGPIYEAWVQKRDLPFIIISPQLPLYDFPETNAYFNERRIEDVPQRRAVGVPARVPHNTPATPMTGKQATAHMANRPALLPKGWETVEADLLAMLKHAHEHLSGDQKRTYITGLSYGGFGTWFMASQHPELFAAAAPVAGWGHPSLMGPIAQAGLPVWCFAGGLDPVIPIEHFYPGLNILRDANPHATRFTVHEDMAHDVWRRVYAGGDFYQWLLGHSKP